MTKWPDLYFPPINLLVLPKHEVFMEYISAYYAKHYGDLWDQKEFDNGVSGGTIKLTVQGMMNE